MTQWDDDHFGEFGVSRGFLTLFPMKFPFYSHYFPMGIIPWYSHCIPIKKAHYMKFPMNFPSIDYPVILRFFGSWRFFTTTWMLRWGDSGEPGFPICPRDEHQARTQTGCALPKGLGDCASQKKVAANQMEKLSNKASWVMSNPGFI